MDERVIAVDWFVKGVGLNRSDSFFGQTLTVEPNIALLPEILKNSLTLKFWDDAINEADILVLLVDHKEFKVLDKKLLNNKIIVETKGVWV